MCTPFLVVSPFLVIKPFLVITPYAVAYSMPEGLEDVSKYPDLFIELAERGWSREDLEKLAGKNIIRVFKDAEKVCLKTVFKMISRPSVSFFFFPLRGMNRNRGEYDTPPGNAAESC